VTDGTTALKGIVDKVNFLGSANELEVSLAGNIDYCKNRRPQTLNWAIRLLFPYRPVALYYKNDNI